MENQKYEFDINYFHNNLFNITGIPANVDGGFTAGRAASNTKDGSEATPIWKQHKCNPLFVDWLID